MGIFFHQISHFLTGFMGVPLLHLNASAKYFEFCTVPLIRHSAGECGSVITCCSSASGRTLEHHRRAYDTKNSCWGVRASSPGSRGFLIVLPEGSDRYRACQDSNAFFSPPLSAMFSPRVRWPLRWTSLPRGSLIVKLPYWLTKQLARVLKASSVELVHH